MSGDLFQHLDQCPGVGTSYPSVRGPESPHVQFEGLTAVVDVGDTRDVGQGGRVDAHGGVVRVFVSLLLPLAASKVKDTSLKSESEIHLFEPHSIIQNKYFNVISVYKTWIGRPLLRPSGRYRRGLLGWGRQGLTISI